MPPYSILTIRLLDVPAAFKLIRWLANGWQLGIQYFRSRNEALILNDLALFT
jgi:hypothetical protein